MVAKEDKVEEEPVEGPSELLELLNRLKEGKKGGKVEEGGEEDQEEETGEREYSPSARLV